MPSTSMVGELGKPALTHGSLRKLGVPYLGLLTIRILLFGYYIWVPCCRKPPQVTGLGIAFIMVVMMMVLIIATIVACVLFLKFVIFQNLCYSLLSRILEGLVRLP